MIDDQVEKVALGYVRYQLDLLKNVDHTDISDYLFEGYDPLLDTEEFLDAVADNVENIVKNLENKLP